MTRAAPIAVCLSAAGCGVDTSELFDSAAPGQIQATGQATTLTVDALGTGSAHTALSNCGGSATITATCRAGSRTVTAVLQIRFVAPGTDEGQSVTDAGGATSDAGPSAAPFAPGDAVLIGLVDGPEHFGVQTLGTEPSSSGHPVDLHLQSSACVGEVIRQ